MVASSFLRVFAAEALLLSAIVFDAAASDKAYLFSYFSNKSHNGRKGEAAGLHLAYSYDGRKWIALNGDRPVLVPTVGKRKLMRDPSMARGPDGTFHMVWTTGWKDRIIGYAHSKDLVNWSEQRAIPVMVHEPKARNSWAPEVTYNPDDGRFYIYWATTIPGADPNERRPRHRLYMTSTKDWNAFSKTRLWFDPGFGVIDAALLRVDGGAKKWLMVVKNEENPPSGKNIRTVWTDDPSKKVPQSGVSSAITDTWVEGPSPLKVGGSIYVYFDCYTRRRYGAVRSDDNGKTWRDATDEIDFPTDARHGTAFEVDKSFVDSLVAFFKSNANAIKNPVWERDFPDPTIWRAPDGTYRATSTSLDILKSSDFINWTSTGKRVFMREDEIAIRKEWKNIWAPEVYRIGNEYLLYASLITCDTNSAIAVYSSKNPEGPFSGEHIITRSRDTGIRDTIDPEVVRDDRDGKLWLFFGSTGRMHRVRLAPDGKSLMPGAEYDHVAGLWGNEKDDPARTHVFEAANLHRRGGWWYLFVSRGFYANHTYKIAVGRAKTLDGPFLDRKGRKMTDGYATNVIESKENDVFFGPGHNGEIVTIDGRDYIIFHCHVAGKTPKARPLFVTELTWDNEGWPHCKLKAK